MLSQICSQLPLICAVPAVLMGIPMLAVTLLAWAKLRAVTE